MISMSERHTDRPDPASDRQNILVVWNLRLSDPGQENRVSSTYFAIVAFLFYFIFLRCYCRQDIKIFDSNLEANEIKIEK